MAKVVRQRGRPVRLSHRGEDGARSEDGAAETVRQRVLAELRNIIPAEPAANVFGRGQHERVEIHRVEGEIADGYPDCN